MQRSEAAAIRMQQDFSSIEWLYGDETICHGNYSPDVPFSTLVIEWLNALSRALMQDAESKFYPDVVTFAFFCRKAHVTKLKEQYDSKTVRMGRGLVFHIAPSNVPVNFAYSLVAGLLAGNMNVVRVSQKSFPQVELIVKHLHRIKDFNEVSNRIAIVRYPHDSNANEVLSGACAVRVIWGGDGTIDTVRQNKLTSRATDVCFADRYSIAAINADKMVEEQDMVVVAERFYNDTYLFDQNACSAPHLIVWTGTAENVDKSRQRFWKSVHDVAEKKYGFQDVMAVDKLTATYRQAVAMPLHVNHCQDNLLRRVSVEHLPTDLDVYRCAGGYFTEYCAKELDEIAPIVTSKYQTLAYYGYTKERLQKFVFENRLKGLDRIVPLGETTTFSLTWDGMDLIERLSRIIDIQ